MAAKKATKKKAAAPTTTPRHQWTNGGAEVLVLKCVSQDGTSYGGFQWPLTVGASVEAPDWNPAPECGGGLHGWAWGFSFGDGKEPEYRDATWLVFGAMPMDVVEVDGKVKAKRGTVRYVGDWYGAWAEILGGHLAWIAHATERAEERATRESGAASATGWRGAASATGERGAASATRESGAASATGGRGAASATGGRGAASATGGSGAASATGWSGAASATGESGAASATGERGAASATGWRGAASATGGSGAASATGESSIAAVTGLSGRARAGQYSAIALAWWNESQQRQEMRAAETGCGDGSDGKLRAGVWYVLDASGQFVKDTNQLPKLEAE